MKKHNKYEFLFRGVYIQVIFCIILFTGVSIKSGAQSNEVAEYKVKSVFLYNFTQFIDWPRASFKSPEDPFIIAIAGDDPFGNYLDETVAGEKFGTHPIIIRRYGSLRDIGNCHILYINSGDDDFVRKALNRVSEMNTLTVSDDFNFIRLGGMIRLYKEFNKVRLEINVRAARSARLDISSKLLSVSKVYDTK